MAFNQLEKKDYMKTSLRAYFLQNGFNYGIEGEHRVF